MALQGRKTLMSLHVLALPRYGALGASSRMRLYQYFPVLKKSGLQVEVQPLFDDAALSSRYLIGRYGVMSIVQSFVRRIDSLMRNSKYDLLWIEKEALPWWPQWFESALLQGTPYVLDFDDAVFHNYDLNQRDWVRHLYGKRLDRLMKRATLVVGGNEYLTNRAKTAGAPWVEVLPTVIDLKRYPVIRPPVNILSSIPRIVWIGSPSTARYLNILHEPLRALTRRMPFVLRVIGASVELPGVDVECVPWTDSTEVASIAEGSVGVMPLLDTAWERGKCGYKLVQYMACGLPIVASPVGVNSEILQSGCNGFLATTNEDWLIALEGLLTNPDLCTRMGREGRMRVEKKYCLQVTGPRMVRLLTQAAQGSQ
jgi:glycosyltransferase involved in cell wall biosynthesis